MPDDYAGEELVQVNNPPFPESPVIEIQTDSADAKAIHELWSRWHGGAHESYLQLTRTVAMALNLHRLREALETAEVLHVAAGAAASTVAGEKPRSSRRTKKGARRAAKKSDSQRNRKRPE